MKVLWQKYYKLDSIVTLDFLKEMINNDKYSKTMEKDQYYSIEEVASMLKVAYLTVYRWIQAKRIKALKAGKQYRIKKEDLDKFLKGYKT